MILERDFESKKHGYSANSYLALLEDLVIPNYTNDLIFIQDNALIYTAKKKSRDSSRNRVYESQISPLIH